MMNSDVGIVTTRTGYDNADGDGDGDDVLSRYIRFLTGLRTDQLFRYIDNSFFTSYSHDIVEIVDRRLYHIFVSTITRLIRPNIDITTGTFMFFVKISILYAMVRSSNQLDIIALFIKMYGLSDGNIYHRLVKEVICVTDVTTKVKKNVFCDKTVFTNPILRRGSTKYLERDTKLKKTMMNNKRIYPGCYKLLYRAQTAVITTELYYPEEILRYIRGIQNDILRSVINKAMYLRLIQSYMNVPVVERRINLSLHATLFKLLEHIDDSLRNRILSLCPERCYCYSKCVVNVDDETTLANNSIFIICKMCCQPLNYKSKYYIQRQAIEDADITNMIYCNKCNDSNVYHKNIYTCNITDTGDIVYAYDGLIHIHNRHGVVCTNICTGSRTCYKIVTNPQGPLGIVTTCKRCKPTKACMFAVEVMIGNFIADVPKCVRLMIGMIASNAICIGCILYCFSRCRYDNVSAIIVRRAFLSLESFRIKNVSVSTTDVRRVATE